MAVGFITIRPNKNKKYIYVWFQLPYLSYFLVVKLAYTKDFFWHNKNPLILYFIRQF